MRINRRLSFYIKIYKKCSKDTGDDQFVDSKILVTPNGNGSSDPDDGIAFYEWTQESGTSVIISNPTIPNPTFTSPETGSDGEKWFRRC